MWQEITYQRGIVQMIAEGYLCDVRAMQIGTDFDLGNVQVRAGDYTDSSLGAELERSDALEAAAKAYRRVRGRPPRRRVHADDRHRARAGCRAHRARAIRAEAVDGKMPTDERRAVLARLHRGETRVVCQLRGPDRRLGRAGRVVRADAAPHQVSAVLRPDGRARPASVRRQGRRADPRPRRDRPTSAWPPIADLAGLPPGSVKKGQSLLDAAEEQAALEKRKIAVAAQRTRQIDLLRRSELRWLDVEGAWVLPAGAEQVMILMPASDDGADDTWDVWRSEDKGRSLHRESGQAADAGLGARRRRGGRPRPGRRPVPRRRGLAEPAAERGPGIRAGADGLRGQARRDHPRRRIGPDDRALRGEEHPQAEEGGSQVSDDFERVPPHDVKAEQCVLGGMMLSKDAIADVADAMRPADHYRPAHQIVHTAILRLDGDGKPADAITVADFLAGDPPARQDRRRRRTCTPSSPRCRLRRTPATTRASSASTRSCAG